MSVWIFVLEVWPFERAALAADIPSKPPPKQTLAKLADIATPPPVEWVPQTWGWVALAVVVGATLALLWVRARRRREANRYRVEALAELVRLEAQIDAEATRATALAAIAPLLKRVALAVWPRAEVASMSGARWTAFLRAHAGDAAIADEAVRLLDDAEYRSRAALNAIPADEARACARAARAWIEGHRA